MFLTIKKKTIFALLLCGVVVGGACATYFAVKPAISPKPTYSIVIDAGHGGRDGGAVGKTTGITESQLNLDYALTLKDKCEEFGMKVILTRSDMNGLYDENAPNKKKSEMAKRKEIINNSGADLMISLHMNSFPLSSSQGAHVFYAKDSESGFKLAKSLQKSLCEKFDNARDYVSVGDYFVLNYSSIPSALVECGFLSNPQEEQNLANKEYREQFCYHLLAGIISYFEM